ncbi:trypsin-like peptidase domain-containing protein [Candidatus Nucleicultrix amoebiphila]|nr:trypsin-like peptidase domain-containing protein [Candidatus Nucleicultrix amoebiphila]
MRIFKRFFVLMLIMVGVSAQASFDQNLVLNVKKNVVSITTRKNISAYSDNIQSFGTGFIVNKEKGIILTNKHVVGAASIASYEVSFFDGTEVDAQFVYVDPWHDFAFIKVNPKQIPAGTPKLVIAKDEAVLGEPIFIIGKNANQNYSLQTGEISSIYESIGTLPNQSYRISLNARGGASGSPVVNMKGEVVALIHSSDFDNFAFALPMSYANDALVSLLQKKQPSRKHTGMILDYYSLDRAVKYFHFPQEKVDAFMKSYPDSFNRGLRVLEIFKGSPAMDKLQVGDMIWSIEGEEIGPKLYLLEKKLNDLSKDKVKLSVYREGKLLDVEVGLYDLFKTRIKRMVSFGGAVFYERDDFIRKLTNAPEKSVFISNIKEGSSFSGRFPPIPGAQKLFIKISSFSGKPVETLDDLIKVIPELIKMKNFNTSYKNYGVYLAHDNLPVFSHSETCLEVSYNDIDGTPMVYDYDDSTGAWKGKEIPLK